MINTIVFYNKKKLENNIHIFSEHKKNTNWILIDKNDINTNSQLQVEALLITNNINNIIYLFEDIPDTLDNIFNINFLFICNKLNIENLLVFYFNTFIPYLSKSLSYTIYLKYKLIFTTCNNILPYYNFISLDNKLIALINKIFISKRDNTIINIKSDFLGTEYYFHINDILNVIYDILFEKTYTNSTSEKILITTNKIFNTTIAIDYISNKLRLKDINIIDSSEITYINNPDNKDFSKKLYFNNVINTNNFDNIIQIVDNFLKI